ncbi:Ivy family c-type lysozyme inhibitor [Dyella sp. 20L07]|uniref:Ivy family c-type lysozyme inhibitor n=1 Tax=Dyella sp. 20L07 TaxID=3384240 RepID=UPI003D2C8BEB
MQYRFIIVLGLAAACVACSQKREDANGAAAPSGAASAAHTTPTLAVSESNPSGITYFYDLLQHPDFASAFAALSGAEQLPPWTSQGGTSTPAQQVQLSGRTQLLATACKPHDCPSERILVLYDQSTHAMCGVFARRKAGASNDVDSNDPANDDLIWLGAPDDAAKHLLREKLYSRE